MSFEDEIIAASQNSLEFVGKTVTLRNQSLETDSEGEVVYDEDRNRVFESPETEPITANITRRGSPTFEKRADSIDEEIQSIVFTKRGVNITTGSESQHTLASRIVDDGQVFRARDIYDEGNGILRVDCVLED